MSVVLTGFSDSATLAPLYVDGVFMAHGSLSLRQGFRTFSSSAKQILHFLVVVTTRV